MKKSSTTSEVGEPTAFTAPMPGDELSPGVVFDGSKTNQQIIEDMMALRDQREAINKEYDSKRDAAIKILLAQLAQLDYKPETETETYSAPKLPTAASEPSSTGRSFRAVPVKSCEICGVPGHDGRAHRGQRTKRPFTGAELARLRR